MLQRIHAGLRDVGIGAQVPRGVELGQRARLAGAAAGQEMRQAEHAERNVVRGPVPGRVEIQDRPAALALAVADVVQQRIEAHLAAVEMGLDVPGRIEIRVGTAALPPTDLMVVADRIETGFRQVGVGAPVVVGLEQPGVADLVDAGTRVGGDAVAIDHFERPDIAGEACGLGVEGEVGRAHGED